MRPVPTVMLIIGLCFACSQAEQAPQASQLATTATPTDELAAVTKQRNEAQLELAGVRAEVEKLRGELQGIRQQQEKADADAEVQRQAAEKQKAVGSCRSKCQGHYRSCAQRASSPRFRPGMSISEAMRSNPSEGSCRTTLDTCLKLCP